MKWSNDHDDENATIEERRTMYMLVGKNMNITLATLNISAFLKESRVETPTIWIELLKVFFHSPHSSFLSLETYWPLGARTKLESENTEINS